jgi:hypothetical protein
MMVKNWNVLGIRKNYLEYFAGKFKKFKNELIRRGNANKSRIKATILRVKTHLVNQLKVSRNKAAFLFQMYENFDLILKRT